MSVPSSKLSVPVLGMSLAAVATVLYLSPVGGSVSKGKLIPTMPTRSAAATDSSLIAGDPTLSASKAPTTAPKSPTPSIHRSSASASIHRAQSYPTYGSQSSTAHRSSPSSRSKPVRIGCWDFKWQQDAQAEYLKNLSDPWGLDTAPGPNDGDGIACTGLRVDPARAASKPIGAYQPPAASAASKQQLLAPSLDYYGVAQNGLPGDTAMFDSVAKAVDKAPSAVELFSGWDSGYSAASVKQAWARQAMPVITWMSKATLPGHTQPDADYSFTKILAGEFDDYLYKYAGDVVRTNLPVVIRFDHEMNGGWYPWGAGAYNNTPAQYIAVWQYIWKIFDKVGANEDVSWLWAPARVDNLSPHGTGPGGQTQTTIAEDYPGNDYVDLVGATVYLRQIGATVSYADSFAKTMGELEAVSDKPIFFPEIGAIETTTDGQDGSALKATWIKSTMAGILADPRVIGFVWFNNVATTLGADGPISNDWRFTSSPEALKAFKKAVADPRFASGVMPDAG